MSDDFAEVGYLFPVKKALRYISLYGLSRTLVKIRGHYHMTSYRTFGGARWINPRCPSPNATERQVAMIGCGKYAFSNIAYYLRRRHSRFLRLTFDKHRSRAMSLCKAYRGAAAVADWREILADPQVRIVFIASNHASHAEYALACIAAGKHVHIEKPHVVTHEQLDRLASAMRRRPQVKVFVGFNRPRSPLFRQLQGVLASQPGPMMINWFIAGHEITEGHWYFNASEGGRVVGNLCHWTDLTLHLVSLEKAFPCKIVPATPTDAKSDFVVSIIFADRSCAMITFSAKGHAFEGVREVLNVHRGNVLASLSDFQTLTVDLIEKKTRTRLRHRDHGHEANIVNSLNRATSEGASGEDIRYLTATARFFLAIRDAIDQGRTVSMSWDDVAGSSRDTFVAVRADVPGASIAQ
jgi:predicted dehydrogenase